jgi:alanine racemase
MELRSVMSLRTRVVAVKGMRRGETSGYGARFVANRPMRVAVIPAGYADGMDLRLGGRGSVLVRERRAPIITVSMDSTTIDVTDISAHPGDDVVVLGEQGDNRIDAREIAASVGTVPHEILCRIGSRIQRTYNRETVNP